MMAEVGYVFDPEYGGQGFETEAVRAVIEAAFGSFGFLTVVATTDEDNLPSRALCERLGMRLTAMKPSEDGRDVDECVFTLGNPNPAR
jgi:RimJ/RimL family protein N-acetyltransferase